MFRPKRAPKIKGLSINKMIPNILTLLALCAGLTAIRFGLDGKWEQGVIAIFIAGILDGLDGRIARLLHGTSKFGAELDSLSDFVSFGVAPSMLLYFWTMEDAGGLGWALVLLFAVCAAMRLARFNTMIGQPDLPGWAYNFFTGVPTPAGAALALLPMIATFQFGPGFFDRPSVVGVFLVGVSFLMVSTVPTFSFKRFRVPLRFVMPSLVLVGVVAAFLVSEPWATIAAVLVLYLVSIPLSIRRFQHLKRHSEIHPEAPSAHI